MVFIDGFLSSLKFGKPGTIKRTFLELGNSTTVGMINIKPMEMEFPRAECEATELIDLRQHNKWKLQRKDKMVENVE